MDTVISFALQTNGSECKPAAAAASTAPSSSASQRCGNVKSVQRLHSSRLIGLYHFVYSVSTSAGLQHLEAKLQRKSFSFLFSLFFFNTFMSKCLLHCDAPACTFAIAFEMASCPALGDFFLCVIMHVWVIWALVHSHHSTAGWGWGAGVGGSESGLPEPAVISIVSAHIVTKCPAELTDVKIHLDANHAGNRSGGLPAARNGPGRPRRSE